MRFSLVQIIRQIPIAVVDLETTGASAALGDRAIEVGIARIEGGKIVAEYQQLIDPQRRISPGITALTGITNDMLRGQPTFADQLPAMMPLMKDAAILGHNIPFDLSFLYCEFRRMGLDLCKELESAPVLDTVRMARQRFGRGGNSLPVLSRRLGVPPVVSHRALADVQTTAAVFNALLEPVGGWDIPLCDVMLHQGGPMDLKRYGASSRLPLELEEALELKHPVLMEYVDANSRLTQRIVQPIQVRRHLGDLVLVAFCQLRQDHRHFKVENIVRLNRINPDTGELIDQGEQNLDQANKAQP